MDARSQAANVEECSRTEMSGNVTEEEIRHAAKFREIYGGDIGTAPCGNRCAE